MAELGSTGSGRLWAAAKVALAFLIAPGVASLGFAILLGSPRFVGLVALYAYPIALLVGLPAYLVLRLWGRLTLLRATIGGGLVVALPVLAALLSRDVPWEARSYGWVTATNRQRTVAGYVELVAVSAFLGSFGALGGALFWLIVRPSRPPPGPPLP